MSFEENTDLRTYRFVAGHSARQPIDLVKFAEKCKVVFDSIGFPAYYIGWRSCVNKTYSKKVSRSTFDLLSLDRSSIVSLTLSSREVGTPKSSDQIISCYCKYEEKNPTRSYIYFCIDVRNRLKFDILRETFLFYFIQHQFEYGYMGDLPMGLHPASFVLGNSRRYKIAGSDKYFPDNWWEERCQSWSDDRRIFQTFREGRMRQVFEENFFSEKTLIDFHGNRDVENVLEKFRRIGQLDLLDGFWRLSVDHDKLHFANKIAEDLKILV